MKITLRDLEIAESDGTISRRDIEHSLALWLEYVKSYGLLLLASPVGVDLSEIVVGKHRYRPPAGVYYDASTMSYIVDGRRLRYSKEVLEVLDELLSGMYSDVARAAIALIHAKILLSRWRKKMEDDIKALHIAVAVLAYGGYAEVTAARWENIRRIVAWHMDRLDNFYAQIRSGEQPLDGRMTRRATLYVNSAFATFVNTQREVAKSIFKEERRVLGEAEHCPDCVAYAARGWQPIGTLPPIGDSACKMNCKCHFEYR